MMRTPDRRLCKTPAGLRGPIVLLTRLLFENVAQQTSLVIIPSQETQVTAAGRGGCPEPAGAASGAARTSRAKGQRGRAHFAGSASHMQRGNLTAPPQTHTGSVLISHRE